MLSRDEIIAKLKEILRSMGSVPEEKIEACTEDTHLLTDLGLSSVDFLYMVIFLEQSFDIRFDNVEASDFQTVRTTVNFIEEQLKKN